VQLEGEVPADDHKVLVRKDWADAFRCSTASTWALASTRATNRLRVAALPARSYLLHGADVYCYVGSAPAPGAGGGAL
jgi:hypothetical protein